MNLTFDPVTFEDPALGVKVCACMPCISLSFCASHVLAVLNPQMVCSCNVCC